MLSICKQMNCSEARFDHAHQAILSLKHCQWSNLLRKLKSYILIWKASCRHGPAFGLSTSKDFGEPLPEVLLRASKGCTLVDRADTLHRHLSGKICPLLLPSVNALHRMRSISDCQKFSSLIQRARTSSSDPLWSFADTTNRMRDSRKFCNAAVELLRIAMWLQRAEESKPPWAAGSADGITCANDKEVTEKLGKEVKKEIPAQHTSRLLWGQLRGISDFYEDQVGKERQKAAAVRARAELQAQEINATVQIGKNVFLTAYSGIWEISPLMSWNVSISLLQRHAGMINYLHITIAAARLIAEDYCWLLVDIYKLSLEISRQGEQI